MPQPAQASPTVLRMIIARQLQELRESAGLSYEQAAAAIYTSPWTIRRMERADGGLKLHSVKGLLLAYGVTDPGEIARFLDLASQANKHGWWHSYSDVLPSWFAVFPGLEQAASVIGAFEPQCVPGLLQTPAYARALVIAGFPAATASQIDRRVAFRLGRQQVLDRPDPPHLRLVIDEAALRRPVGGLDVMRAQLDHLIEASGRPGITVQVLPAAAGAHPGMCGVFYLFRFAAPALPDIVYAEHLTSALYLDKPADVARYAEVLDDLAAQAAPAARTLEILDAIMKEH